MILVIPLPRQWRLEIQIQKSLRRKGTIYEPLAKWRDMPFYKFAIELWRGRI